MLKTSMVNKLILLLLWIALSILCCTKDQAPAEPVVYGIEVKVNDGVEYTTQIMTEFPTTRNQKPNASATFKSFNKIGSTGHLSILTLPVFKDELFGVKVTKENTGQVLISIQKKATLELTWKVE